MRVFFRPVSLYVLLSYLALSLTAWAPLCFAHALEAPWRVAGMTLAAWLLAWSGLGLPRLLHVLLLPAFLALPGEWFLQMEYGQSLSTHHLGILAETSPKEALEFLGYRVWWLAGVLAGLLLWWYSLWRALAHTPFLVWSHRSRYAVMALYAAAGLAWWYGAEIGVQASTPASGASASSTARPASVAAPASGMAAWLAQLRAWPGPLPAAASILYDQASFARSWPFGLAARFAEFWEERRYLNTLTEKSRNFRFHAHTADATPRTLVVVIGESSRYDRWSLNGYARDTTPLLRQEAHLLRFSDMVTAVAATRLSVPILLTRKPATQSLKAGFAEKSFLSAFKEAGFKTFWLSNQMSFGQFDTPISVFAQEADVTQFLNLGGFTNQSSLDAVLDAPFAQALADPAQRKLIVLHTLGNHWNYSHRHPAAFDHWKPSLFGVENPAYTDLKNKVALSNSYDNSVLYTDTVLDHFIGALKVQAQPSLLLYVSDHGQTLYDGQCHLAFHGHNTAYEFHIPAFVWFSEAYLAHYPEQVRQTRLHQHARLSTENVFPSLLELGQIALPDATPERSFASPHWRPRPRYVDSYGWSDYDHSTQKGDCREIIDRGTPLTQEK